MHAPAIREAALGLIACGIPDGQVAEQLRLPRTTVRDWRLGRVGTPGQPLLACPRCGRGRRRLEFTAGDYAELLGLYLGDGYVGRAGRTYRLRLSLDATWPVVRDEARDLLRRCFPEAGVGTTSADRGATSILSVYGAHLPCLFPQHGPGKKHERPIVLEDWQQLTVDAEPWRFLRGLFRSDGCAFVNRTGPYAYFSYDFTNHSQDILGLFGATCDRVGVRYRRYPKRIRIYQRGSVELMRDHVGIKS